MLRIAHLEQPNFALRALSGLIGEPTLGIRIVLTGPKAMKSLTRLVKVTVELRYYRCWMPVRPAKALNPVRSRLSFRRELINDNNN